LPAKKKGSPRETAVHELRGTISEMLNPDKKHSDLDDSMDSLDRAIRLKNQEIDQKVNAAYKLKKMEQSGMFSKKSMLKAKKDMGIEEDDEVAGDTQDSSYGALAAQIAVEPDANKRDALTQQLVILNVYKELKGRPQSEIQVAVNNIKGSYLQAKLPTESKSEDFRDKMLGKFMDKMLEEKKSDSDNFNNFADMVKKVQEFQPKSEGLKEMVENVKGYKELGLIKDSATTIEEKKLDIEKLKVDKEYELREKEITNDSERTKSLVGVGGDILSSVFDAVGSSVSKSGPGQDRSSPPIRQDTLANAMNATCVTPGCGSKILITNIDQSREISCQGCNQRYLFDADKKQLFTIQAEEPAAGRSPIASESNQDTSQSSTA